MASYNFLKHKNTDYYASVGVSSYIMKNESYNYYYERNNVFRQYDRQYTGNSHFLSILTISAGIHKKISDKFSLVVEPSLGIPLKGVGDGSVKLYSKGLNLRFNYFPF